tara:strand:- start:226 stop:1830 length:1605 start_codon:yes stop_codon:yes gene_type:complete
VIPIGRSVNGFEIFALRVRNANTFENNNNNNNSGEENQENEYEAHAKEVDEENEENEQTMPSFGFIGNMHGDEPLGREIALRLAEWACGEDDDSFFGNNIDLATKVKNKATLYFIPTLNPDGFVKRRRENANGVDLNRDFPFIEFAKPEPKKVPHHVKMGAPHTQNMRVNDLYDDTLRQLQPETRSIIEFSKRVNLTGALNYHEGALVANYPWDGNLDGATKYSRAPDDNIFKHAASIYAQSHGKMKLSKEFVGGITNGAQWYPLWGGMQDWHYVKTQTLDITIEVNDRKWPLEDTNLGEIIRTHCRASIDTAHAVMFTSARGFVFDKSSNEALEKCEVRVENVAVDRRILIDGKTVRPPLPVFTNKRGYFVKPIYMSGEMSTFEIMVTCPEASQTHRQKFTDVDVSNGIDLVVRIATSNGSDGARRNGGFEFSSSSSSSSMSSTVDVKQMNALRTSSVSLLRGALSPRADVAQISPKSKRSKYILFGVTLTVVVILVRRQRRRRAKLNAVRRLETNGQTFLNSPVPKASSLIS